jgi:hypothetical protein
MTVRCAGIAALMVGLVLAWPPLAQAQTKWLNGDVGLVKKGTTILVGDEQRVFGKDSVVYVIRVNANNLLSVWYGDETNGVGGKVHVRDIVYEPPLKVQASARSAELEEVTSTTGYRVHSRTTQVGVTIPPALLTIAWAESRMKENKQLEQYVNEYRAVIRQLREKKLAGDFVKRVNALREFRKQRVGLGLPQENARLKIYLSTRIATFLQSGDKPAEMELEALDTLVPTAAKKWSGQDKPPADLAIAAEGLSRVGRIDAKEYAKVLADRIGRLPEASAWGEDDIAWICSRLMQLRGEVEAAYLSPREGYKVRLGKAAKQLEQLNGRFEKGLYHDEGVLLFVLAEINVLFKEMLQAPIQISLKPATAAHRFATKLEDRNLKVKWEAIIKDPAVAKLSYRHKGYVLAWVSP